MLVGCGDGLVLIEDYENGGLAPQEGAVLPSVSFTEQMRVIVERHQRRYPSLTLEDSILKAAGLQPAPDEHGMEIAPA